MSMPGTPRGEQRDRRVYANNDRIVDPSQFILPLRPPANGSLHAAISAEDNSHFEDNDDKKGREQPSSLFSHPFMRLFAPGIQGSSSFLEETSSRGASGLKSSVAYQAEYASAVRFGRRGDRSGHHRQGRGSGWIRCEKIVTWRFGYASPLALSRGLCGSACRGEEHVISLRWGGVGGGRRSRRRTVVRIDGADAYELPPASERAASDFPSERFFRIPAGGVGSFGRNSQCCGGHAVKISGSRTAAGARQFELEVDGLSFFGLRKVYQLGMSPCEIKDLEEEIVKRDWDWGDHDVGDSDDKDLSADAGKFERYSRGHGGSAVAEEILIYEEGGTLGLRYQGAAVPEVRATDLPRAEEDCEGVDAVNIIYDHEPIEHQDEIDPDEPWYRSVSNIGYSSDSDAVAMVMTSSALFLFILALERAVFGVYPNHPSDGISSSRSNLHFFIQAAMIFALLRFSQRHLAEWRSRDRNDIPKLEIDPCITDFYWC